MADSTDSPDLVASTGVNDSNSPWNGLLQTALTNGVSIGGTALEDALNLQTPLSSSPNNGNGGPTSGPNVAASTPAGSPVAKAKSWLPWILGGAVVVFLGWLLLRD